MISYHQVDGLVMSDMTMYYQDSGFREEFPFLFDDIREWQSDCTCAVCREKSADETTKFVPLFQGYDEPIIPDDQPLTNHKYMLLPSAIPAFVFKTRVWGKSF